MIIGGLEKFSLIDFPGHLAAIIFTQACNFRCHFCYNPMLVVAPASASPKFSDNREKDNDKLQNSRYERSSEKSYPSISEDSLFIFLESRRGKLEGIVISGGEPTLQPDLPDFIRRVRALGYKIKLDTNGTDPDMLASLIDEGLLDYIAMDLKAPFARYAEVIGRETDLEKIRRSIAIIIASQVPYEFRTTIVPGLHSLDDIAPMGESLRGAAKWYLQKFQGETPLVNNNYLDKRALSDVAMQEMVDVASSYVDFVAYR